MKNTRLPLSLLPALIAILSLSLVYSSANAASIRCGRNLISPGDHLGELVSSCGEPLVTISKTIYRSGIPRGRVRYYNTRTGNFNDLSDRELIQHQRSVVEVPVEVWTYNFGPRQFMREVTIIDGRVDSIKTLGYGH